MVRQRGFTLIELLVTLTVLAILVGIGMPNLRDFMLNNRRAAKVNELVASLQYARSEAVARNQGVSLCTSSSGTGCTGGAWDTGWIVFTDPDLDGVLDAGTDVVVRASEPRETLDVTSPEFGTTVTYRPSGRVAAQGQFIFCDPRGAAHARVVQLDPIGRPNVAEKKIDGSDPTC